MVAPLHIFQRKFEDCYNPDENGCWIWNKSLNKPGYGQFYFNGKYYGAHRASWMIYRGPIPDGLWILHRCDVRACVNPNHLFLGTNQDNILDAVSKGRHGSQVKPWRLPRDEDHYSRLNPGALARGSRVATAILSESDVTIIKKRLSCGESGVIIGRDYGVGRHVISFIKCEKTWRHVPWPVEKKMSNE